MKKIFTIIVVLATTGVICAQPPQKMSYQCVVRSVTGALVTNHAVGARISILQGSATGTVVFSETYSPAPQTNANGLLTVEIGSGTASVGNLAAVDWSAGSFFLKTETDPDGGTNYTITGTSQLLSVPYALYAKTAANGFSGSYNDLTNKPILFDGTWNSLTGKPAGFADGIDNVDDADNSITNEIQALNLSGTVLSLSNGGGSVTLPSSGGGDNWGTQTVVTDATLSGNGTTATPLKIAQQSATSGQVLKWDGTTWKPDVDLTGAFTLPYSGTTSNSGAGISVTNSNSTNYSSAISGHSSSSLNTTCGVSGSSASSSGVGVYGKTEATTGLTMAVRGESRSSGGYGVVGSSISESGSAIGVMGTTLSPTGLGVSGRAPACAVHGVAEATSGSTYGIYGIAASSEGTAIYGIANSSSGINYGVYGKTVSATGFSGYFTGGKFYISGNIGIGNENPAAKLEVNGQVKITGGNPGAGKVLTSDATGLCSWQTASMTLPFDGSAYSDGVAFSIHNTSTTENVPAVGISGSSDNTSGIGIKGYVGATSGNATGVYGETKSPAGFSGYFKGGKFYVEGNVGIGKTDPAYKLDVSGNRIQLINGTEWIAMRTDGSVGFLDFSYSGGKLAIGGSNTGENILLNPGTDAWVGVRTWNPQYELDVSGNIRATGSVYYGGTAGSASGTAYTKPDYVFAEDYSRLTTDDVEEFVKGEGHLPWITSARDEKKENGDVTDMTRMAFETVESVENMQLQIIEQDKMIRELKKENDLLKERLGKIESKLGL